MLFEGPFQKGAFAQQGSYRMNQRPFGLWWVMVKQNQFPKVKWEGFQAVWARKFQARQPALGCNTHLNILRSELIGSTEGSIVSGSLTINGCGKPKMVARSSNPEM